MTNYPGHSPEPDALKETPDALEFPIAPGFRSRPPQIDSQAMLQRIAETMAWRSHRPGEQARRLAQKIPVEFVL